MIDKSKYMNLSGQKFNHLTAIELDEEKIEEYKLKGGAMRRLYLLGYILIDFFICCSFGAADRALVRRISFGYVAANRTKIIINRYRIGQCVQRFLI